MNYLEFNLDVALAHCMTIIIYYLNKWNSHIMELTHQERWGTRGKRKGGRVRRE